jgi:O-succinylbenzoic acid--CoA ligase
MQANHNNELMIIDFNKNDWKNLRKQTNVDKWQSDIIDFIDNWFDSSDFIKIKTSGSTGIPKTITVRKKYMAASAKMTCDFFNLSEKSTALLCLSAGYIAGKMMIVRAIIIKMKLICISPSNNPVKQLTSKIDFAAMIPYQVGYAVEIPEKFNFITNLIIGGGQIHSAMIKKLQTTTVNCFETFGMTETLSHIALRQIAPNEQQYFNTLKNISICQGVNNELIINAPKIGAENLKTTDIVELKGKNNFIWKGRLDFVINSGGIKIYPEEIEAKISDLISEKFYITGIFDKNLGEKVVLIIEGNRFDTSVLFEKIKKRLPKYHCPKEIRFIDKIPLTLSGKIKRTVK